VPRGAAALALLLIVGCLFNLRMKPDARHDVELQLDAAFNYRMTYELVKHGAVPALDTLSTYPEGKPVTALLPTGLYSACAAFSKVLNLFTSIPLKDVVLMFCALCGALLGIPIYFISLELYGSRPIALVSAALAGMIPVAIERTLCYWYRDEVLAVPILFFSLLFFLRMFGPVGERSALVNGSISMALLVLAFYVWRLCILFLVAYAIALVYLAMRSAMDRRKVAMAGGLLLCVIALLFLFLPGFGRSSQHSNYGGFPQAVWEIGLNRLGITTPFSGFTRLVSDNMELFSAGPRDLTSRNNLSWSLGFPLVFVAMSFVRRERSAPRHLVFAFVVLFGLLTVLVFRNVVFLAPLVAVTAGESLAFLRDPARGEKARYAMLAVSVVLITKTGMDGYRMATVWHRDARLGKSLVAVLQMIDDIAPKDAVVSCNWPDGYMVQSYSGRATLTDGLFESGEIVSRILEESEAYYSTDEDRLWNYCVRHGAAYLLVPANRTWSYADQAGLPYEKYFDKGGATEAGKATVLYRMIHEPETLSHFKSLYHNPVYTLYEVLAR
jgi:hypothetical protein